MSLDDPRVHRRIQWLIEQVQQELPEGYRLGYEMPHTHAEDTGEPLGDERILRYTNHSLAQWRDKLDRNARRDTPKQLGAFADRGNLPEDAAAVGDAIILFEILHRPTGVRAVRTVRLAALRNLAESNRSREEKIGTVRTYVQDFLAECQRRVQMAESG